MAYGSPLRNSCFHMVISTVTTIVFGSLFSSVIAAKHVIDVNSDLTPLCIHTLWMQYAAVGVWLHAMHGMLNGLALVRAKQVHTIAHSRFDCVDSVYGSVHVHDVRIAVQRTVRCGNGMDIDRVFAFVYYNLCKHWSIVESHAIREYELLIRQGRRWQPWFEFDAVRCRWSSSSSSSLNRLNLLRFRTEQQFNMIMVCAQSIACILLN